MLPNFSKHKNQSLFHPPLVFKFVFESRDRHKPATNEIDPIDKVPSFQANRSQKYRETSNMTTLKRHVFANGAKDRQRWISPVDGPFRFTFDVRCPQHRYSYTQRAPQINLVYAEICTATNHPVANYNRRNCVSYQAARCCCCAPLRTHGHVANIPAGSPPKLREFEEV